MVTWEEYFFLWYFALKFYRFWYIVQNKKQKNKMQTLVRVTSESFAGPIRALLNQHTTLLEPIITLYKISYHIYYHSEVGGSVIFVFF